MANESSSQHAWLNEFKRLLIDELRGQKWDSLIAKRIDFEQSLLAHTIVVVDTLITISYLLNKFSHQPIGDSEFCALIAAAVAHDAGKAHTEFQRYIRGHRKRTTHWDPSSAESLIVTVAVLLRQTSGIELTNGERAFALSAVRGSIREERTATNLDLLATPRRVGRESYLRDLLGTVDQLASCSNVIAARQLTGRATSVISRGLVFTHHQVRIRGATTAFLHQALQEAHQRSGWLPLLFYADGTLYVATSNVLPSEAVLREQIQETTRAVLSEPLKRSSHLVVGSVLGTFLPKPELFDVSLVETYLLLAAQRAKARRPDKVETKNVIEAYNGLSPQNRVNNETEIPLDQRRFLREELGSSQPEMAIFKFFKSIVGTFLVGPAREVVRQRYEELFGEGTFSLLMGMSTLMPANDYLRCIRWYHKAPGDLFAQHEGTTIADLSPKDRQVVLVTALASIAHTGLANVADLPGGSRLARSLGAILYDDVLYPKSVTDIRQTAEEQLSGYRLAKVKPGMGVCPTCNATIVSGHAMPALADFYDKPDAFSNRRSAHGRRVPDSLCLGCYYERLVLQILTGRRPEEVIFILPEMQLTLDQAETLNNEVRKLEATARQVGSAGTFNPRQAFDITATWRLTQALEAAKQNGISFKSMLRDSFTYETSDTTTKKRMKELARELQNLQDVSLELLSNICGRELPTWDDAAEEAVREGSQLRNEDEIMGLVRRIFLLDRSALTPVYCSNFIAVPIVAGFAGQDDAEVKVAIRRLVFTLFISIALETAVAAVPFGDASAVLTSKRLGVAYVPAVGGLRRLVGSDWVPRADARALLDKLVAAVDLTSLTDFPKRSDYYVLAKERERGKVVRRIEQVGKGKYIDAGRFEQIDALTGRGGEG
jgi:hypothetical protein